MELRNGTGVAGNFVMKFIHKHVLALGRLFALTFFLASSGFTVVLYHCTMGEMSACTDYCMAGNADATDQHQPAQALLSSIENSCHTVTVAGGLRTDPSVVERGSIVQQIKVDFALSPDLNPVLASRIDQPILLFSTRASNFSPPTVETYLLNSTFLI